MRVEEASRIVEDGALDHPGIFYGNPAGLALGAGLILTPVDFPSYSPAEDRFVVWNGPVLVLSHECDLDQDNQRLLNDLALVCPVRRLDSVVEMAAEQGYSDNALTTFLGNLGRRRVSRAIYLPPFPDLLPFGGFLYLNQFSHTSVKRLAEKDVTPVAALTAYAMQSVDYALASHLFRVKSDRLPHSNTALRRGISIVETRKPSGTHSRSQ